MDYSYQQNRYPYHSSQPYNPSHLQTYDRQSNYSNYQYQQNQPPPPQYQQPQQQYSSYYTPNYSNTYHPQQYPQTHQQWRHQAPIHPQQYPQTHQQWRHQAPIRPPGVSSQPSSASHGQVHAQLPYQQNLPQRTDGVVLGLNPAAVLAVAALAQLNQHAGLHGQSWYPHAEGSGPVIGGPGPGLGAGARPSLCPGPSRLLSHAGRSLDKGGTRGGVQHKSGGRGKSSNIAGVARCELCKIDCGKMSSLKLHEIGKRHRKNLKKLEAENRTVSDIQNVQKPSGDLKPGTDMKPDGQHKSGGGGKFSNIAGVARCELCKVDFGKVSSLKQHVSSKRHRKNLKKLEAENRTVSDIQNVQKPSGDIKPETNMKPDDLPKEEETKQKPPENIPLDTVPSEIKLGTELKISDAQCDVVQTRGLKRKMLGGGGQEKKISKAKRRLIVIPLMCDLCNVKFDTRENLRSHLLGRKHKSKLKCFEGRLGLQALYPPNPITQTAYHWQGVQQIFNGTQVSDPIAGASVLPQTHNVTPSATGVSII
ncbi:PREDICTED: uncharacterized protein LOC109214406 isoform X2 [Nicotiana attenuata]|uniref:uncharacterized protein LOC109214406 isoform X2 n=1 Tax=Nicotiana attenuata TaxID=49451 RepID=UPI000904F118|nr:PREDICTED: uncharacterized protein LOC109214406 isoform X2 [Nicotiana attenuata]